MDQTEYMYFVNIPLQQNTSSVETQTAESVLLIVLN